MTFDLVTPNRISFGPGRFAEAGGLVAALTKKALVVCGRDSLKASGIQARLEQALCEKDVQCAFVSVSGEPDTACIDAGVTAAKNAGCGMVIGIGGGSVLDSAKAIAGLLTNEGSLMDHLEVVGKGLPLENPAAPLMAVPTTAGTGSEATSNAVIKVSESNVKVSLRSPFLLPRIALVDPELTYSLPPAVTASTGMDALTQLIESCASRRAGPVTDALAFDGIGRASRSLERAYLNGKDGEAREEMMLAALYSGITLSNAGLGAVHGIAAPLGGAVPVPHGAACAALLPCVMETNVKALKAREPGSAALLKYAMIGRLVRGRSMKDNEDDIIAGIEQIRGLQKRLGIQPLSRFGLTRGMIPAIADRAMHSSSMKANPVLLTKEEIISAMEIAL